MMTQQELKNAAAQAALHYIPDDCVIGVGTGSTAECFIAALANIKHKIKAAVASSIDTEKKLKMLHIPVYDLNAVDQVAVYVDGTDEFNQFKYLIKGGGGALTREKIIAAAAQKFICITDAFKEKKVLGEFPVAIEVIPMARGLVARTIVKMGGTPQYRAGFITDNDNIILDIFNLDLTQPIKMEEMLNNITGSVCNGIFAKHTPDIIIVAEQSGIRTL